MPSSVEKLKERNDAPFRIDIKFPVLGFLMEAELTGYDLKRQFQGTVGFFYRISDGSLYPALKKLARDRLVTMRTERKGKRARKVYAITPLGRERFMKMLAEPSPPVFVHDEAQVKIFFGHYDPQSTLAHMERMRRFDEQWANHLSLIVEDLRSSGASPFREVLVAYGQQLTAFKAEVMAKLQVAMARKIALAARGNGGYARKTARPASAGK